jgi:hypothetical protein
MRVESARVRFIPVAVFIKASVFRIEESVSMAGKRR